MLPHARLSGARGRFPLNHGRVRKIGAARGPKGRDVYIKGEGGSDAGAHAVMVIQGVDILIALLLLSPTLSMRFSTLFHHLLCLPVALCQPHAATVAMSVAPRG